MNLTSAICDAQSLPLGLMLVIHTMMRWLGAVILTGVVVSPAVSVALPTTSVCCSCGWSLAAVRISTLVSALGEVITTWASFTGWAKVAIRPMPGLRAGKLDRYLSVRHEVAGSPSMASALLFG